MVGWESAEWGEMGVMGRSRFRRSRRSRAIPAIFNLPLIRLARQILSDIISCSRRKPIYNRGSLSGPSCPGRRLRKRRWVWGKEPEHGNTKDREDLAQRSTDPVG